MRAYKQVARESEQASAETCAPQVHPFLTALQPLLRVSVMKANTLLLLLAAVCSQLAQTHAQSISLTSCPISIFGEMHTNLQINQNNDDTRFCFTAANSNNSECIDITGANEFTAVSEFGTANSELEGLVKSELPQLNNSLTCYLKINLSTNGEVNMTIGFLKFGSQTVLSVHLASYQKPYVLVQSLDLIAGFTENITKADGESTKYLDLSGCRIGGQVIFPGSTEIPSENCTNQSCNNQGDVQTVQICGSKETCGDNNKCQPKDLVCTVLGGRVIQFWNHVSSIPDRCMYSLLEPVSGSGFKLLAAFADRHSQSETFLNRLDLELQPSNITISLETSGTVRANGEVQTFSSEATEVNGVLISRNDAGVTLEIIDRSISDVNISIFFDGSTAYIKVPNGAQLQGLCGNPSNPTYSPTLSSAEQSASGCDDMPTVRGLPDDSEKGIEQCSQLRSEPFTACHEKVPVEPHIQSCNSTVNSNHTDDSLKCHFFKAYAEVCKQQYDIDLGDWGNSVGCSSANHMYCMDHTCNANEFCVESPSNQPTCHCRAIFASKYKLNNAWGEVSTCSQGKASISLIGCLLEENGYNYMSLHLKNETCKGQRDNETHLVTFNFDTSDTCGTETESDKGLIVLKNRITLGSPPSNGSIITRQNMLDLNIMCTYQESEIKTLTFHIKSTSMVRQLILQNFNYTLVMQAYADSGRTQQLAPDTSVALDQEIWIQLSTEGLNENAIKIVTNSCWVTQQPMPNDTMRYDLIIGGCPNLEDGTVKIVGNGLGTHNYFSFRMFQFVNSTSLYLHCKVNLCASTDCAPTCSTPNRKRRALEETHENFDEGLLSMRWT